MKSLCVYCSSSDRLEPKYYAAATELGEELGWRQWTLVYGGGRTGLMGALARGVKSKGGRVVGVIPEFMKVRELEFTEADELICVLTMRERKMLMETRADAFLALPGGWGTLEELTEMLTWLQLSIHAKPIGLLNVAGYFDHLLAFAETMVSEGFVRVEHRSLFCVAEDPERLIEQLAATTLVTGDKGVDP